LTNTATSQTVTTLVSGYGFSPGFPAGGPFIRAYVLHVPVILTDESNYYLLATVIPNTDMNEATFNIISQCLIGNATNLEQAAQSEPIGWIALSNSELAQSETHTATKFTCNDQMITTSDRISTADNPFFAELNPDGTTQNEADNTTLPIGC